ncbi:melanization protease 1-like [Anopheles aquasalis]|uniref:melanization protease 1-like n=1 Tax=Anopheles aquasalis TaxID=42839 RepID=UPI00215A40CF|nr:melanization protease 1-like [Anopheles aquasalis]
MAHASAFGRVEMSFMRRTIAVLFIFAALCFDHSVGSCTTPEERCVPLKYCSLYGTQPKATGSGLRRSSRNQPGNKTLCTPEMAINKDEHVCCSTKHIKCSLNGKLGVCTPRPFCPSLSSTTEKELMKKAEINHCYQYNTENYFCCTDQNCVYVPDSCNGQKATVTRSPSIFPKCVKPASGKKGYLIPKELCDGSRRKTKEKQCCVPPATDRTIVHPKADKLMRMRCGVSGLAKKVANGEYAVHGEFPWMVALVYGNQGVQCGGTLIHPSYILTAGHCVTPALTRARLGTTNMIDRTSTNSTVQEITIGNRYRHPHKDIAVLELVRRATIVEGVVTPICLPITAKELMYIPKTMEITGWGLTEENVLSTVLLKAEITVELNKKYCVKDDQVCTAKGIDSMHCRGDSGGPYQAAFNGTYVQYAVISVGRQTCSQENVTGRGIMVAYYINWILDQMEI